MYTNENAEFPTKNISFSLEMRDKLLTAVSKWYTLPEDAYYSDIDSYEVKDAKTGNILIRVVWRHNNTKGEYIKGEYISITMNPVTMEVTNFEKVWNLD